MVTPGVPPAAVGSFLSSAPAVWHMAHSIGLRRRPPCACSVSWHWLQLSADTTARGTSSVAPPNRKSAVASSASWKSLSPTVKPQDMYMPTV